MCYTNYESVLFEIDAVYVDSNITDAVYHGSPN